MSIENILVVDDDKRVVESIRFFLDREGFQVTAAYCGEDALALVREKMFDLVLLDVSMPGMNGFEVMNRLFDMDSEILVVMVTGYASVESAVKALKQGAWDYLRKPFENSDLIKTVKNALNHKRLLKENRDVTARLDQSQRNYRYLVNNSPDLIYTLDGEGCFTFVNDSFERILGYTRGELLGAHFSLIICPEDMVKADSAFNSHCRNGKDRQAVNLRLRKSPNMVVENALYNDFVFVELKASGIFHPGSQGEEDLFQGTHGVARDVTQQINLEDQLRQAQKMEAIGTLAGGIAHDFNNILMGIQGYTSLVRATLAPDSPEFKKLVNVDEYVQSGSEMTRQLLGFAQKSDQSNNVINLNYLLKMSARMFGRTKKDVTIRQNLQKDLWNTQVDEGQIKQVLLNLYVNAWQAMPCGGTIYIKSENVHVAESKYDQLGLEKPGRYVRISVVDTGVGMDREVMARIFDPFFTTKEMGGGTGLGLATAYGIIKSHGGAFRVLSKIGEGSSFSVYLPARDSRVVKAAGHQQALRNAVSGRGTILVVDDEENVLRVCAEMLESLGYEVKAADSGKTALRVIEDEPGKIDLVILDMIMPEMSGVETFEKIKRLEPKTRVLLSSGYSKQKDVAKVLKKGCEDFIQKPFDVVMLSEKIRTVFDQAESNKARQSA